MAKPQKRRVVPQLVSQVAPPQPAFEAALQKSLKQDLTLKQQSELAAKLLGSGRRIYVNLKDSGPIINYRKLLKEAGVQRPSKQKPPSLDLDANAGPDLPPLLREPGPSKPVNIFASVIQRLEKAYVINQESEEEDEEDEDEAAGPGEQHTDDSDTDAKANRAPKDDVYDLDDEFIDDGEFLKYYSGDRRKAKYTGFYINKGEIEKVDERVPSARAPKKPASQRGTPKGKAQSKDGEEVRKGKLATKEAEKIQKRKLTAAATPRTKKLKGDPTTAKFPDVPSTAAAVAVQSQAAGAAPGKTVEAKGPQQQQNGAHTTLKTTAPPLRTNSVAQSSHSPSLPPRGRPPSAGGSATPPNPPSTSEAGTTPSGNDAPAGEAALTINSNSVKHWVTKIIDAASKEPPLAEGDKPEPSKRLVGLLHQFSAVFQRCDQGTRRSIFDALRQGGLSIDLISDQNLWKVLLSSWPPTKPTSSKPKANSTDATHKLKAAIKHRMDVLKKQGVTPESFARIHDLDSELSEFDDNKLYDMFFNKEIEDCVFEFITAKLKASGSSLRTNEGRTVYREVVALFPFPDKMMNDQHVVKMYRRQQNRLASRRKMLPQTTTTNNNNKEPASGQQQNGNTSLPSSASHPTTKSDKPTQNTAANQPATTKPSSQPGTAPMPSSVSQPKPLHENHQIVVEL